MRENGMLYDRQGEDNKYSWLYDNGYGVGPVKPVYDAVAKWLGDTTLQSVVDVGCGHAALLDVVTWCRYTGTELASSQLRRLQTRKTNNRISFVEADVCNLRFDDADYDVTWCCDVLEHLPTQYVLKALSELCRVGKRVVIAVCCRPSGILSREGDNLHLTVRDIDWWESMIARFADVELKTELGDGVVFGVVPSKRESLFCSSCAVVGNAPSLLGKRDGSLIDSFDDVVRFNNFSVEDSYAEHTGVKTTTWVTSFWHDITDRHERFNRVLCPFNLLSSDIKIKKRYGFNNLLLMKYVDDVEFMSDFLLRSLHGRCDDPSTGIALLYWMYQERGFIDNDAVWGFNFFCSDQQHHYQDDDVKKDGHNGDTERCFYNDMLVGDVAFHSGV